MRTLLVTAIALSYSAFVTIAGEVRLEKQDLSDAISALALPEGDTKFQTWSPIETVELTRDVTLVRLEFWRESEKFWDKWDEAILVIERKEDHLRAMFGVRRWHTEHRFKGEIVRRHVRSETKEIDVPQDVAEQFAAWLRARTRTQPEQGGADHPASAQELKSEDDLNADSETEKLPQ